jgi:hypothetical protein
MSRASTFLTPAKQQDVDGRDKPGHDALLVTVYIAASVGYSSPTL